MSRIQFELILKRFPKFKRFVDSLAPPVQDVRYSADMTARAPSMIKVPSVAEERDSNEVRSALETIQRHTMRIVELQKQIQALRPSVV